MNLMLPFDMLIDFETSNDFRHSKKWKRTSKETAKLRRRK